MAMQFKIGFGPEIPDPIQPRERARQRVEKLDFVHALPDVRHPQAFVPVANGRLQVRPSCSIAA
jgi:hypothetical protein